MKQKKFIVDLKKMNLSENEFYHVHDEIIVMVSGKPKQDSFCGLVNKQEKINNKITEILYINHHKDSTFDLKNIFKAEQELSKREVVPVINKAIIENQETFDKRILFFYKDFHVLEIYSHPDREDVGILTLHDKYIELSDGTKLEPNKEYNEIRKKHWIVDEITDLNLFVNKGFLINESYPDMLKNVQNLNNIEDLLTFGDYIGVDDDFMKAEFARKILLIGSIEDKKVKIEDDYDPPY